MPAQKEPLFLPHEIILQILSYLVTDIDNLSKPWTQTSRLFRNVMEENLEQYCSNHGLNYKALKAEHDCLIKNYKSGMLPLPDFIECAVTRGTIHNMGRYDFFENDKIYPYIPSVIYQMRYLQGDMLPTKDTLRMAMIVGNVPLCLSLLKDPGLHDCAKSILKSLLKGKGTRFSLHLELASYTAALPWEVLNRALSRTFIACYEALRKGTGLDDLPSPEEVIRDLLAYKEFLFVEECIKHWGIDIVIPFAAYFIFSCPYSNKRATPWYNWLKQLYPYLSEFQQAKLAQTFHDSFLRCSSVYFSWYDANTVLSHLKENPLLLKTPQPLCDYTEYALPKKESSIRVEHIFNKDPEYLNYLLKQGMEVSIKTLLLVIESIEICTPSLKELAFQRIRLILNHHFHYLSNETVKEALWSKAIRSGFTPIMQMILELTTTSDSDSEQKILAALQSDIKENVNILKLYHAGTLLQAGQGNAIKHAQINTIYYLIKSGIDTWHVDWQSMAQTFLEKEDYQKESTLPLLQYLLDHQLITPTLELSQFVYNYTKRLLHFVYQETYYTVNVNLGDLIRFQWNILEILMKKYSEKSDTAASMMTYYFQESLKYFELYIDPSQYNHLMSMLFCNAFRLKVLHLFDELFLQKRYPALLAQLEKTSSIKNEISKILALLEKKWWRKLLTRYPGSFAHYAVSVASELILNYEIKNLEVIQNCIESSKDTALWYLVKPLMEWKIKISKLTTQDERTLNACFDKDGYFLGPIGNRNLLEWKNRLCPSPADEQTQVNVSLLAPKRSIQKFYG